MFENNLLIKEINLADNLIGLVGIPQLLLAHNPDLEYLALGGNKLKSLPEKFFDKSSNIRQLYLQANQIKNLSPKIFRNENPRDVSF